MIPTSCLKTMRRRRRRMRRRRCSLGREHLTSSSCGAGLTESLAALRATEASLMLLPPACGLRRRVVEFRHLR
jgi:hypothetical protein